MQNVELRNLAAIVTPVLVVLILCVAIILRSQTSLDAAGAGALRPATTGALSAAPLGGAALATGGDRAPRTSTDQDTIPVVAPRGDVPTAAAHPATRAFRIRPIGPPDVDAARARFELWSGPWRAPVLTPRRDGEHLVVDVPLDQLTLRSLAVRLSVDDGAWSSGAVELGTLEPSALANADTILTVALAPTGSLNLVCVLGHARAPERLHALVHARTDLAPTADFGGRSCPVDWRPTPRQGQGRHIPLTHGFERVPAGPNRVEAHEVRSLSTEAVVQVRQGALTTVVLDLAARPLLGSLGGVVHCEQPLEGRAGIVVQNVDDPSLRFEIELRSPWLLEDVPVGTYEVVGLPGSPYPVEPPTYRVSAASTSLDFAVRNAAESIAIGFEVTDAATGARLDGVQLHLERPNGGVRKLSLDHMQRHERLPRNSPVRWKLLREGFEPTTGTIADFVRVETRPTYAQEQIPQRLEKLGTRPGEVEVWLADVRMQRTPAPTQATQR